MPTNFITEIALNHARHCTIEGGKQDRKSIYDIIDTIILNSNDLEQKSHCIKICSKNKNHSDIQKNCIFQNSFFIDIVIISHSSR